jgi:hypothetical protein
MQLTLDRRLGGAPRLRLVGSEVEIMQLPDIVRKCVVMLSYQDSGGVDRFAGTAFLAAQSEFIGPQTSEKLNFVYLITARHVIEKIHQKSIDKEVCIRINQKDGVTSEKYYVATERWLSHPDDLTCDVAVISWRPPRSCDVAYLMLENFVTDEIIDTQQIGLGTDLFVTGIFRSHRGAQRNIPIIRSGAIAAMPEEPIATALGPMQGYLAELRSVGGLSGSPVFVFFRGLKRWTSRISGQEDAVVDWREFYLLGLVHGHWNLDKASIDADVRDAAQNEEINVGITIVTPTQRILEVINRPEFANGREQAKRARYEASLPTMDSSSEEPKPFSREEFEAALGRVSRRLPESDEEKS